MGSRGAGGVRAGVVGLSVFELMNHRNVRASMTVYLYSFTRVNLFRRVLTVHGERPNIIHALMTK